MTTVVIEGRPGVATNAVNLKEGYPLLEIRTPREILDDE